MNREPEPKVRKKRYDENFKRSAVEHWLGSGKSANQVAAELGINAQTLKIWKQQLAVMPPGSGAPRTVEALEAENRRLRRELGSLIRQRETLKKR
jgi:transposase-like protein